MAGIRAAGGLANEAFRAALKAQQEASKAITSASAQGLDSVGAPLAPGGASPIGTTGATEKPGSFVESLEAGMREVSSQIQAAEALPDQLVNGQVSEFHEVAVQLKQSDLSFRFALQVRNKLIDAYREVMRMSV